MRIVMEFEMGQGRQVYDVHEKNLGYDITSLDLSSGELRLIEVKGLGGASGTILLTPNERYVAEVNWAPKPAQKNFSFVINRDTLFSMKYNTRKDVIDNVSQYFRRYKNGL